MSRFYQGDTQGERARFLAELVAASRAAGASRIKVTSGYRSPAHNAAVGGVPHSLHTRGQAMDGYAFIHGQWVPLGVALKNIAGRFGLRSGDVPGFYHGGLDPVHVDTGGSLHGGPIVGGGGGGGFNPHAGHQGINSGGMGNAQAQALQLILGVMSRNKERQAATRAPLEAPMAVQRALPGMMYRG